MEYLRLKKKGKPMFKKILLPTDGSEISKRAVTSTVQFAKEYGSEIVGLSVAVNYPYFGAAEVGVLPDDFFEVLQDEAMKNAAQIAELALAAGVAAEVHIARGDSVSEEIVKAAEQYGCDSIFMASHGRRGFDKLMLGSEAQKVLIRSPLPVTIIK